MWKILSRMKRVIKSLNKIKIIDFSQVESYHSKAAEYNSNLFIDSNDKKSIIFIRLKLFMPYFI